MGKPRLTDKDFERAAKRLRCEVAAIRAVAEVESRGAGFYGDGFPVILFERHKFRHFTKGKYNESHPKLSGPAGGYGPAGKNQREKFSQAFALDAEAAMKSCSWGKFQIMGFNYEICGFDSVGAFVDAMKESEGRHLDAFVEFVIANGLDRFLRSKNWKAFASGYNGSGYRKNAYDTKMAAAYGKYAEGKNSSAVVPADEEPTVEPSASAPAQDPPNPLPENEQPPIIVEEKTEVTQTNQQDVSQAAEVKAPEPQGIFTKLSAGISTLVGGTVVWQAFEKLGGITFTTTAIAVVCFVVFIAFLAFCFWAWLDAWKQKNRVQVEADAKTAIDRKDIVWK